MVRAQVCAVLGFVMLLATSTDAREVELSIENRIGGDSNVFGTSQNEVDDGFYEFAPRLDVREERDEINYNFRYMPVYQAFFDHSSVNGWDHVADGELAWNITPRDSLGMSQRFSSTRRIRLETVEGIADLPSVVEENDRERIRRINSSIYFVRQFTPTVGMRAGLEFEDIDFNHIRHTDTRSYGGSLGGNYAVSPGTVLGLSGSARRREARGEGRQSSSTSLIGNVGLSLASELTETLEIFLQAGPAIIRTEDDNFGAITTTFYQIGTSSGVNVAKAIGADANCNFEGTDFLLRCPVLPYAGSAPPNSSDTHVLAPPSGGAGRSGTDISFFAEAKLTKRWRRALLRLSYSRSESSNDGVASSSIVDSANVYLSYRPEQPWYFVLFGQWSQRQVVEDVRQSLITVVPGDSLTASGFTPSGPNFFALTDAQAIVVTESASDNDLTQWRAVFRAERRLSKRLTLLSRFSYVNLKRKRVNSTSRSDEYRGFVGLRYTFDPVIF